MENRRWSAAVGTALLAALLARPGGTQEDVDDSGASDGPRSCLPQPTIRRTKILSNRNIVFFTRQDAIYNNELPKQCASLNRRSLVNYGIANGRVCAGDRFQVMTETSPKNFLPGPLCELGTFVPITEAELEDLTAMTEQNRDRSRRGRSKREAVTTEQVELPPAAEPASVE